MPKQTKKTHTFAAKPLQYIKSRKLLSILVGILLIIVGNFAYNKYLDWDNAQMIRGLSRDFSILVEQIERETGLDLEIESNCMTTTEKFSDGVRTCEYLVVNRDVTDEQLSEQNKIFEQQSNFAKSREFENGEGYIYKYRNKSSCEFSYQEYIYISCITGVRDANVSKINKLLSGN